MDPTPLPPSGPIEPEGVDPSGLLVPGRRPLTEIIPAAIPALIVALVVGLSYLPNVLQLIEKWNTDPDYSHGYLVIPIALAIFWQRWPRELVPQGSRTGWLLVLVSLLARLWFHYKGNTWSETATLVPVIAGLGLARVGWPIFARIWPGFAFMVFLLPLPPSFNATLSRPLQKFATIFSVMTLKATGLWVINEGNVIIVDSERLQVQDACNGLAMLMSLSATVAAAACLVPMTMLKRLILLASIIPVALLSNVIRISATAWSYHQWGAKIGSEYAHDMAGYLMMPLALILVGLELRLVSFLVVEASEEAPVRERIQFGTGRTPSKSDQDPQ